MENQPTYQEIKHKLEDAIEQAYLLLPTEEERIEFVGRASLDLQKQQQEGLLSEEEYKALGLKLSLFAKEAFSAFHLADDLSTDSWLLH